MISSTEANANNEKTIHVILNEERLEFSIDPYLTEGTTLVQFRPLFEAMDIQVTWNQQEKSITGMKEDFLLEMKVDSDIAIVNGEEIELLKAPEVIQGNTMVPIRFISESTGALVAWNPYHPEVIIYTDEFMELHGVTRVQVSEAITEAIEQIRLEVEEREAGNTPIEPVPVPDQPAGDGKYVPANSDDVDLHALQGMYQGFVPDFGGYKCGGTCWEYYTFFPSGQVFVGPPPNGGPETIHCGQDDCYDYTIKDGALTLSNGDTYSITVTDGQLVIDDVRLTKVLPVEQSLTLDDQFKHLGYQGYVGIGGAITWTYTIEFRADGTFISDNVMLGSVQGGDSVTHGGTGSETSGSYRISGNTLTLAYGDGTVEHQLFFIHETDSDEIDDIQIGSNNYYF